MSPVIPSATLALALVVLLGPSVAFAQEVPTVTGVRLERAEGEVRAIVAIDHGESMPAHRLMRDDRSLRLLLIDTVAESSDLEVEDQTLHRVRVRRHGGRSVIRLDPHASPVGVLDRSEVRPHPEGLVVVVSRSERETDAWREANRPPEPERAAAPEGEESEAEGETAAAAVAGAASDSPPRGGSAATPPGSRAASSAPAGGSEGGSTSGTTMRAAAAAGAIVLLGMAAIYFRRRKGRGAAAGASRSIDVVSARRLGARQSLLLVEVDGQSFLIGVSDKGMVRLAELGDSALGGAFGDQLEAAVTAPAEPRRAPEPDPIETPALDRRQIEDGPTLDAVEGLLRLKRMAGTTAPSGHNGEANGKASGHGHELTLAGLESLLQNRAAN